MAADVEPNFVADWKSGNAAFECNQAGGCGDFAYKIDDWNERKGMDGVYGDKASGNTITISYSGDGKSFDWASEFPVCTVIVKAGKGAYLYRYEGSAYGDSLLVAPEGKAISHVTFCFDDLPEVMPITVTKTAVTSYDREHLWEIAKKVETDETESGESQIWLYTDGSGDESATWTVDATYKGFEHSGFNVSGEITVFNSGIVPVEITSITDVLAGGDQPIAINCGGVSFPYTLEVGETLTCTYSEDGYFEGQNVVTVTTDKGEYSATADIEWGDPANEINETVNISDISDLFDVGGLLGHVTAPNNAQFTYSKDFAWADYGADGCGDYSYGNTATIVETEQSASATLNVSVQCINYETAYAKGDSSQCFSDFGFSRWGWTNPIIIPGNYVLPLWAAAAQCDTSKGTLVGLVSVSYGESGLAVTYHVDPPFILDETHVYAGIGMIPTDRKGKATVAPGAYSIGLLGPQIYIIAHAVVGVPDPNFGPVVP